MSHLFVLVMLASAPGVTPSIELHTGDIILHTSTSSRSELIRRASKSPYSHVGLIEVAADGVFVIEAIEPVSRTPLAKWVARGANRTVTVLRSRLEPNALEAVLRAAKAELGKPYDVLYRWDDERLYCSELVVKAFERGAQVSLGVKETVGSLAHSKADRSLAAKLHLSLEQELVTPGSLVNDAQVTIVARDVVW